MRISRKAKVAGEQAAQAVRANNFKPKRVRRVVEPSQDAPQSKSVAGKWIDDPTQGCVYYDGVFYWGTQQIKGNFVPVCWTEQKYKERLEKRKIRV